MIDANASVSWEELIDSYLHIDSSSDYAKLFEEARLATSSEDTRRNQTIKYLRQSALFQCIQSTLTVGPDGDFAECGCFRGQSSYMIARMMQNRPRQGLLHLFDSFAGLSEFTPEDNAGLSRSRSKTDQMRIRFAYPEKRLKENLAPFDFVRIYAGWIPERFSEVEDRCFALVHIDVDLYQPTLDSLNFFYPRLARGGWIIVDDYNARNFPGAKAAVDLFLRGIEPQCAIAGQVGAFLIRK